MKRLYSVLILVALLLAGCGTKAPEATEPAAPAPLELLQTVWSAIPEESRFPSYGGTVTEEIQEGPGALDVSDTDFLTYTMLVPKEQANHISQAAALIHLMNGNAFTCGAYQLEGVTAADFTAALSENIQNNQWMCGFPDRLIIVRLGENTVLAAFGWDDAMTLFLDAMTQSYSDQMTITVDEAIS